MKTAEERAEEVLHIFEEKTGMMQIDKTVIFLSIVEKSLKEQDKITRHACAMACSECGDAPAIEIVDKCFNACMNVKAV